ncbi:MAG: aminotransferase class I/II [Bacteroidetes bacterium]|nr:MAG: aminotransferase class I/II [Bacteroidota bacterium]PTM13310.1 MAG: aminotransferase class I/II [Bacteroidota bacterium]
MNFTDGGHPRLDFTSALYLGFRHNSQSLLPWDSLTTGAPAALQEPGMAHRIPRQLARMMGLEEGLAFPSTLHLFRDLFDHLVAQDSLFFFDDQAYPISTWGLEATLQNRSNVFRFPHGNIRMLAQLLKTNLRAGQRPVMVTDGWCPQCGGPLPLRAYQSLLLLANGLLVLDDTQALGVLGKNPTRQMPYGFGGGGMLPWLGLRHPDIVVGSSLAKGFGVPMAVLAGSHTLVRKIQSKSLTRVHCSPPSKADFRATQHALASNARRGDELRHRLYANVRLFKQALQAQGIATSGNFFPVQLLKGLDQEEAVCLVDRLAESAVKAIVVNNHYREPAACFILRADHSSDDIRWATHLLGKLLKPIRKKRSQTPGDDRLCTY